MTLSTIAALVQRRIRSIPDWPQPGVMFRDITPIFSDPVVMREIFDDFCRRYRSFSVTHIASIDARGFLIGSIVAYELGLPLLLVRKQGKLPGPIMTQSYALEYGEAAVEIQRDTCRPGDRIVLFDDLIATGGTLLAASQLLRQCGAELVEAAAFIDLPELGGSAKLEQAGVPVYALCRY